MENNWKEIDVNKIWIDEYNMYKALREPVNCKKDVGMSLEQVW